MATRQKILGLPIGRRRKSPVPKVVAGGGALVLAVPLVAKAKQVVGSREGPGKKREAVSRRGGDGASPVRRSGDGGGDERTASRAQEKSRPREPSSTRNRDQRPREGREGGRDGGREARGDRRSGDGRGVPQKEAKTAKSTNIVESVDVGVPVRVAYNAWTEFTEFPSFMKKVEDVEQESDESVRWTGRILWSDRTWRSQILEQVPEHKIIWRSEGDKGSVDGAVTFHEVAPDLTRILLVLEYHPKGLFEHVGNLWRAQGRRARLELKNFQRHVMTAIALRSEAPEGWRGEIHEGSVADTETAENPDEGEAPAKQGSRGRQEARRAEPEEETAPEDEDMAPEDEDMAPEDEDLGPEDEDAAPEDEDLEPEDEDESDGDERLRDQQDRREPDDGEEEEDGQDSDDRASRRRRSPPVRRRQTASVGGDGDDGDEDTPSPSRRESRSGKNEGFRQEGDGESPRQDRGRSGRVIGKPSGRRVGERQTSEGAKR